MSTGYAVSARQAPPPNRDIPTPSNNTAIRNNLSSVEDTIGEIASRIDLLEARIETILTGSSPAGQTVAPTKVSQVGSHDAERTLKILDSLLYLSSRIYDITGRIDL